MVEGMLLDSVLYDKSKSLLTIARRRTIKGYCKLRAEEGRRDNLPTFQRLSALHANALPQHAQCGDTVGDGARQSIRVEAQRSASEQRHARC